MSDLRAVCHIPSAECLIYHDINHWITQFETRSGITPTDIVLPAITATSTSYPSRYSPASLRLRDDNLLRNWIETLPSSLEGAQKWALIDLQLTTLANDMISLRDQWNQSLGRTCCIINPHVQDMLQTIFGEVRGLGADGVVLDVTDIFPNSTSVLYPLRKKAGHSEQPLQNSCFCKYCTDELKRSGRWTDGAVPFKSLENNLARFVLQPTYKPYGGVDPITVEDSWLEMLDGAALVDFANARGFIEIDGQEQRQKAILDAAKLLTYMVARSKVTAQAIKKLRGAASQHGLSTAVILGSDLYDQSQNVNLSALLKLSCSDEYWVESFEPRHLDRDLDAAESSPALLRVMAARSTYYINSVFEYLEAVSRIRTLDADDDDDPILNRLCEVGAALDRRDQLDRGQSAQIPLFKSLQGFVGVPFKKQDLVDIVQKMAADGSLAESLRNEIVTNLGSTSAKLSPTDSDAPIHDVWG
jgi:hypothetical protein